jgi:hypothetical protein
MWTAGWELTHVRFWRPSGPWLIDTGIDCVEGEETAQVGGVDQSSRLTTRPPVMAAPGTSNTQRTLVGFQVHRSGACTGAIRSLALGMAWGLPSRRPLEVSFHR